MKTPQKELLSIGSVVLLRDSQKRIMIIGYCQQNPAKPDHIYDYCACLYPEGFLRGDQLYLFDHEQILQISAQGFQDEEYDAFYPELKKAYAQIHADH